MSISYKSRDPVLLQASMQQHRRGRSLSSTAMTERDEDLILFHEMQRRERERERKTHSADVVGLPPSVLSNSMAASLPGIPSSIPSNSRAADDIFNSDWDKNDYDWLMTPPGTPLMSTPERDLPSSGFSLNGTLSTRSLASLKISRLGNSRAEPLSRSEPVSKAVRGGLGLQPQANASGSLSTSTMTASRKTLSSSSSALSRSSISGSTSAGRPSTPTSSRSSRPSGGVEAPRLSSSTNSVARPSTPGRPSTPSNRSTSSSRPSTPVRRPSTPTRQSNPPDTLTRSSSVSKASSQNSKIAVPSRPSSPVVKNRGWQPSALPGFSQEPPPNLRTSLPERSLSNSRGSSVGSRTGGSNAARTTQAEAPDTAARNRWPSSSPLRSRGRLSSDYPNGGRSISMNGKVHDAAVELGNSTVGRKSTEKPLLSRKPLPGADEQVSAANSLAKHSTKPTPSLRDVKSTMTALRESSGFGRNLSKKSLDMALRHMDVRRSTPSGFRSFMSNVPASSLYSVKSASVRGCSTNSTADSPMATSSNASSEHSMSIAPDPEGSELAEGEIAGEKSRKPFPASQPSEFSLTKEKQVDSWLDTPDFRDDEAKIMQLFKEDSDKLLGTESPLVVGRHSDKLLETDSPLVSQHERIVECDNFTLEPRQV